MKEEYREVLEQIAAMGCGVPGHAVAVGCGSPWLAREALEGRRWERCPKCHGRRFFMETTTWSDGKGWGGGNSTTGPCVNCGQRGWVRSEPSPKETDQ